MRVSVPVICLLLLLACLVPAWPADWTMLGGNARHQGYTDEQPTFPLVCDWKYYAWPSQFNNVCPLAVNDRVYFPVDETLFCLDRETGGKLWEFQPSSQKPAIAGLSQPVTSAIIRTTPTYYQGALYVGADNGKLYCLDAETGGERWSFQAGDAVRGSPVIEGKRVIFGANDWKVYALDADTGGKLWEFQGTDQMDTAPTVDQGRIYVHSANGEFVVLNLQDGSRRLQLRFMEGLQALPVVLGQRYLLLCSVRDLWALTPGGSSVWRQTFSDRIVGVAAAAGKLYVANEDRYLYALGENAGRLLWSFRADGALTAPPTVAGGVVFAGGTGGLIYAVDGATGKLLWRYRSRSSTENSANGGDNRVGSAPIFSGGTLYFWSDEGNLAALSPDGLDLAPPLIEGLTPADGAVVSGWTPLTISAAVYDPGSGVDDSSVALTYDGQQVPTDYSPRTGVIKYVIPQIGQTSNPIGTSRHLVTVTARDRLGRQAARTWSFLTDLKIKQPAQAQPAQPQPGRVPPGGGFRPAY